MAIALPVENGVANLALVIVASRMLLELIADWPIKLPVTVLATNLSPVIELSAISAATIEVFAIALVLMRESGIVVYLLGYSDAVKALNCSNVFDVVAKSVTSRRRCFSATIAVVLALLSNAL